MERSNLYSHSLPQIPARGMEPIGPSFQPRLRLDGIGYHWSSRESPLSWPPLWTTSPIPTPSPVDDFYTRSFSGSALQHRPKSSIATNRAIHSTSRQKCRCHPMTLVRASDAYVSGGDSITYCGKSKPQFIASRLISATSDFTIMCLACFCIHIHPYPCARSSSQKHPRIRVFGWANWWGNQVHHHGNNPRKLLAILTGCYLWPPRAVADEDGRTLVRHKKTTTQNANTRNSKL